MFNRYKFEKDGKICKLRIKECRPDDECEYACGVDDRRSRAKLFVEGKFFIFLCLPNRMIGLNSSSRCSILCVQHVLCLLAETPVEIIRPPADVFEPPGSDILFEVELNKDRVEVKWMRNNMIIVQGDKYQMISEGKVHRLQVCEIRPRDQGEYRIVAKEKDARAKLELAGMSEHDEHAIIVVPLHQLLQLITHKHPHFFLCMRFM